MAEGRPKPRNVSRVPLGQKPNECCSKIRYITLRAHSGPGDFMPSAKGVITFILLAFSAFGVTFSGPLILRIYSATDKFWDLGPIANFVGGGLDIIGGLAQFIILVNMTRNRYFSANASRERRRRAF